jgi:hypothetical protein
MSGVIAFPAVLPLYGADSGYLAMPMGLGCNEPKRMG